MDNISSNIEKDNSKNGIVIIFKIIKVGLKILFPSYVLLNMNRHLMRVNAFYKEDYFSSQIKKNWMVFIVLTSLFLGPIGLGFMAIKGNHDFQNRLDAAKKTLTFSNTSKGVDNLMLAFRERKFSIEFKFFGSLALFGLFVGNFCILNHSMIKNSKLLIKFFKNEGIVNKDNLKPIVLFTPIGVLVDISGSSPKEIALNDRIWLGMNIKIKDWAEDPEKRSLVFFKTAFSLKSRYDYILPENFK
jgi:hypothetical protein